MDKLLSGAKYDVILARNGEDAVSRYESFKVDLVLMDVSMPGIGGMKAFKQIRSMDCCASVVLITDIATFEVAMSAWFAGAVNCIKKPFSDDQILASIKLALNSKQDQKVPQSSPGIGPPEPAHEKKEHINFPEFDGLLTRIAPSRSPVLLSGASDPVKELMARSIHERSSRAAGPFVVLNFSHFSPQELERIFSVSDESGKGHELAMNPLEEARFGTLFIDNVEDLTPKLQTDLLRLICRDEGMNETGDSNTSFDIRLILASNVDQKEKMLNGTLRSDLYYKLSMIEIEIPPSQKSTQASPSIG